MRALLVMLAAAAVAAGCGGGGDDGAPASAPGGEVVELAGLGALEERFAADGGKPRLLLILSPT